MLDPDMLSAYLDGELTDAERAAVDAQLASSPEWRAELAEVRAARDALRGLSERDAPAGFWDAVLANVAASDDDATDDDEVVVPITACALDSGADVGRGSRRPPPRWLQSWRSSWCRTAARCRPTSPPWSRSTARRVPTTATR